MSDTPEILSAEAVGRIEGGTPGETCACGMPGTRAEMAIHRPKCAVAEWRDEATSLRAQLAAAEREMPQYVQALLHEALCCVRDVACEWARPSVLMRPQVYREGSQWCALYGEDLMLGVAAFGSTPEAACAAFDKVWREGEEWEL